MTTSRLTIALLRTRVASPSHRIPAAAAPRTNPHVSPFSRGYASTASGQGGSARRGASGSTSSAQGALETLTTWMWRGVYALTGAGIAGCGIMYVTDPMGTTAHVKDLRSNIEGSIRYYTEPSREKLLPDIKSPFPGAPVPRTLILDLDETLIYTSYSRSTGWRVAKRPGAEAFLAYLCNFYEIVVFSSKLEMYVNPILHTLDPNGYIAHRLYRPETKFVRGTFVKDLSVLNRDLARVVVIDHDTDNTLRYHPENGIRVPKWNGDPNDTTLLDLVPFLESLSKEDVSDVREHLAILKERGIKDGVRVHKEGAPQRIELAQEKRNQGGFFFGGAAAPPQPVQPPPADGEEDKANKGAVLFSSKLFRPETKLEVPDEAQGLKKEFSG